ncbi:hypothetical protein NOC27_3274 [Nitrosococcus oceani AFC27]|nr:hypothetical protein NOC27_3274 [Nitrosococcus oceani AFC27]
MLKSEQVTELKQPWESARAQSLYPSFIAGLISIEPEG